MIGHLGSRVSALLDGQLSPEESERLWRHVHACGQCREEVEHQGWVKTQLAGFALQAPAPAAPSHLAGALVSCAVGNVSVDQQGDQLPARSARPTAVVVGVGTMGVAFVGMLAMSVPAQAPSADRRGPVNSVSRVLGDGSTPAAQERRLGGQRTGGQTPASVRSQRATPSTGSQQSGVVATSLVAVQRTAGFGQIPLVNSPWATIAR